MLESPVSLAQLAALETDGNDAYTCYLALTKASQKIDSAGKELCKSFGGLATSLKAPSLAGGRAQVDEICSALDTSANLLSSLYSSIGQKPTLKKVQQSMLERRRESDTA